MLRKRPDITHPAITPTLSSALNSYPKTFCRMGIIKLTWATHWRDHCASMCYLVHFHSALTWSLSLANASRKPHGSSELSRLNPVSGLHLPARTKTAKSTKRRKGSLDSRKSALPTRRGSLDFALKLGWFVLTKYGVRP